MSDAFSAASAQSFALSKSVDAEYLQRLPEKGIEVVELSPEELGAIATHIRETVWPALEENLGKELLDSIKADLNK